MGVATNDGPACRLGRRAMASRGGRSTGADATQDVAHLSLTGSVNTAEICEAEEGEGRDADDGDEGQDEGVLRKALAAFVVGPARSPGPRPCASAR